MEIYFINLRQYLDQKWGTSNPVLIRDPEFTVGNRPGRIRIRAFGNYNFRVTDPGLFFKEIVGTNACVTTDEIQALLKEPPRLVVHPSREQERVVGHGHGRPLRRARRRGP